MSDQSAGQGQQPPGQVPPAQQPPAATPPAAAAPPPAPQQPPAPLNVPPVPPAPQPVPEEISVTFPQGTEVDPEVLKEFKTIMGNPKLSGSQRAQQVVDLQLRQAQTANKKYQDSVAAWRRSNEEALKKDPEFGANFEANKAIAQRPLAKYGDPDLARELAVMGLENHPRLTKFLHKIGAAMGEDKTPTKPPAPGSAEDENEALYRRYPTMRPKPQG